MGVRGARQRVRQGARRGETGSVTGGKTRSKTGSETGSETGRDEFMLGFRVPTTCGKKTLITTYSGEVSPPPANWTTTQCETGGETGSETGGETGSETGSETSHLVKLSLPDILYLMTTRANLFSRSTSSQKYQWNLNCKWSVWTVVNLLLFLVTLASHILQVQQCSIRGIQI